MGLDDFISNKLDRFFEKAEENVDNFFDKLKVVITSTEQLKIEGKKEGYKKASEEYGKILKYMEEEYKRIIFIIKTQQNKYNHISESLLKQLEQLEEYKRYLQIKLKNKINTISKTNNIPISDLNSLCGSRGFIGSNNSIFTKKQSILDMIYNSKNKKFMEAKEEGYIEAKEIYEKKVYDLKQRYLYEQNLANSKINNLKVIIYEILQQIECEKLTIVELEILL